KTENLVACGGLEWSGGEEQPAVIGRTQAIARRRSESVFRKSVGEIGADRSCFRHYHISVPQRRHLAHRIDREIAPPFHGGGIVEHFDFIRLADLFEHPTNNAATRHRIRIKNEFVGHVASPGYKGAIWDDVPKLTSHVYRAAAFVAARTPSKR